MELRDISTPAPTLLQRSSYVQSCSGNVVRLPPLSAIIAAELTAIQTLFTLTIAEEHSCVLSGPVGQR